MVGAFSSHDDGELRDAEVAVTDALGHLGLDFRTLLAVSNIFRAATAVRLHMERSVLAEHRLSWSSFVVLFVLRVWGPVEARALAREAGITPSTLTGVVSALERRELVARVEHPTDGRRVIVSATDDGARIVEKVMPVFNEHEALLTAGLSDDERQELARLLRTVLRHVDHIDGVPADEG